MKMNDGSDTPQARVAEGNKLSKKGEAYWASLEYKAAALSALDECKRLRKLLEHAQRPSAHQVWLEQENEQLQKRMDALRDESARQIDTLLARVDALIELLKRAGMYTSHHSYCYAGVDYVTCICGLEEFSKEVLEAVSESS